MKYIISILLTLSVFSANAQTTTVGAPATGTTWIKSKIKVTYYGAGDTVLLMVKPSDSTMIAVSKSYYAKKAYVDSLFGTIGTHDSLVKYSDSIGNIYVTGYRLDTAKTNLRTEIAARVKYADTATMLSPYLRKVDTAGQFVKSVSATYPVASTGGQNPTASLDTASGKWRSEAYNDTKYTPLTRTISTTSPLSGGGDLSANRTLTIADAVADGTTKGAASFTASDFNSSSGNISLDYNNMQVGSGSVPGVLSTTLYNTFNSKPTGSGTADRVSYWSTTSNLASTGIRSDATRACVGAAIDASYLFKVAGTFNATGNSQFNANVNLLSGGTIDFIGGSSITMSGNSGTGAWSFNTSLSGGYYPSFQNAGTPYLEFKNAGSSFARGNMASFFFVLHNGLFGGTPVSGAIEFNGSNHYTTNSTTTRAIVQGNRTQASGAATLTLAITYSHYVFTGTTTTWTLPAVSGNTDIRFAIKNRGSGAITLNSAAAGNDIYTTSAVNTMTINAGEAYILHNDGTYWLVE